MFAYNTHFDFDSPKLETTELVNYPQLEPVQEPIVRIALVVS